MDTEQGSVNHEDVVAGTVHSGRETVQHWGYKESGQVTDGEQPDWWLSIIDNPLYLWFGDLILWF